MSLKKRLQTLEQKNSPPNLALIAINSDETREQALQRCYPGEKPKKVIFRLSQISRGNHYI